ncbi:MAG: hypothetical protein QOG23_2209 [Blastocatellia bacterium]|nr:hypothetical protein [Blastocatellia bacterium]
MLEQPRIAASVLRIRSGLSLMTNKKPLPTSRRNDEKVSKGNFLTSSVPFGYYCWPVPVLGKVPPAV